MELLGSGDLGSAGLGAQYSGSSTWFVYCERRGNLKLVEIES